VFYLLAPLLGVSLVLAVFGLFLIFRSWQRAAALDRLNQILKKQNPYLSRMSRMMEIGRIPGEE
jgi:hypothetical protein